MVVHVLLVNRHVLKDALRLPILIQSGKLRMGHQGAFPGLHRGIKSIHLLNAREELILEGLRQLGQLNVIVLLFNLGGIAL